MLRLVYLVCTSAVSLRLCELKKKIHRTLSPAVLTTHRRWRGRWTWGRSTRLCPPARPSASPPAPGRCGCGPWRPPPARLTWGTRGGRRPPAGAPRAAAWSTGRRWGRRAHSTTCAAAPPRTQRVGEKMFQWQRFSLKWTTVKSRWKEELRVHCKEPQITMQVST